MMEQDSDLIAGAIACYAYIGTDCGSGVSIREVRLIRRNKASWTVRFLDSQLNWERAVLDKALNSRLFPTRTGAKAWIVKVMEGRVEAAQEVLKRRQFILAEWASEVNDEQPV
jgi:hypothetical protein